MRIHVCALGCLSLFILASVATPQPVVAQSNEAEAAYRATLIELIETLRLQIVLLEERLAEQTRAAPALTQEYEAVERFSDDITVNERYALSPQFTVADIPDPDARRYFAQLFYLYPDTYDERISELIVFADEGGFYDAFVETVPPQHTTWAYGVSEAELDQPLDAVATELMVHELAHILGYDPVLGVPRSGRRECHPYFARTGCPPENSYLGVFVDTFWSEADLNRSAEFLAADDLLAEAETYYDTQPRNYVTAYAASSPEEDFAESFMFYVLEDVPDGGEAAEKVEFFDDYPALREVRQALRSRI